MLEQIFTSDDQPKSAQSPIRNFFRGKIVFLTGGTGFLGKLFIEKLLQCEVREIVLLIRSKRGRTPRERLQLQLEREPIYTKYARDANFYWNRLQIMEGALEQEELGLTEVDVDYLKNNVDIVIHCAADVRFDLSLKASFKTNVFGANQLIQIALGMQRLISFLFISTAYSNCIQAVVEEKFYDVDVDPLEMLRIVEATDEEQLDKLSTKIISPWPNTYTFSKAQAENVFRKHCDRLPIVLIRPSNIISTLEDPIEGWTDNIYGLNGVITGIGSGVLRVLHLDPSYCVDVIPADLVVNSSLATIWYAGTRPQPIGDHDKVFNCVSRKDNPFSYKNVREFCLMSRAKIPAMQTLWFPTVTFTNSAALHWLLLILYHFIPAVFFDILAKMTGREAKVLFLYRKVQQFADALEFFTTNQWTMDNARMRQVYECMSEDDKQCFPADVRVINWRDFVNNVYCVGLRKYILKEDMNNLDQALKKFRMLRLAHYTVLTLSYLAICLTGYVALQCFWSRWVSSYFTA